MFPYVLVLVFVLVFHPFLAPKVLSVPTPTLDLKPAPTFNRYIRDGLDFRMSLNLFSFN